MTRRRVVQLTGLVYLVGALCLGGWAMNLWRSLEDQALAHHLPVVKAAMGTLLAVLVALLVVIDLRRVQGSVDRAVPLRQMAVLAVVVICVATEWFLLLPGAATDVADYVFAVVVAGVGLLAAFCLRSSSRSRTIQQIIGLGLLVISVCAMVTQSPPTVEGSHQRLVWVGLDFAELAAIGLTGLLLTLGRSVRTPATIASCLLVCDAVINIGVAGGHALGAALMMACLELPAAGLSGWLGYKSEQWLRPRRPV